LFGCVDNSLKAPGQSQRENFRSLLADYPQKFSLFGYVQLGTGREIKSQKKGVSASLTPPFSGIFLTPYLEALTFISFQ
jgi:hypothetical protein